MICIHRRPEESTFTVKRRFPGLLNETTACCGEFEILMIGRLSVSRRKYGFALPALVIKLKLANADKVKVNEWVSTMAKEFGIKRNKESRLFFIGE